MRKKTDKYPHWAYGSFREFKSKKRQHIKQAIKSLTANSACGMAYSPAYEKVAEALKLLREAEQIQSVKNWGN